MFYCKIKEDSNPRYRSTVFPLQHVMYMFINACYKICLYFSFSLKNKHYTASTISVSVQHTA